MFLHTWHPQSILVSFGSFQLHWYGVCLALATIAGIFLVSWLARRYTVDEAKMFDLALITLIVAFIGARLYHVSNEWTYYSAHPTEIIKIWNGGLALHGGLLFGLATMIYLAKRQRWNAWLIADILAPAVALGQAIGRWGNYFNQELFGKPTNLPWGIPIDVTYRPVQYVTSTYFHPTFLYESLGLLFIVAFLLWLHRRQWRQPAANRHLGRITLIYVILYSALRIGMETLRLDQTPIIGQVRLPILMSILFIFIAGTALLYRLRRSHATT